MAAAKKTSAIQASEVKVGNRTLEGVLMDLAERSARAEERSARAEERSARAEERSAEAAVRSARAEELATIALQTIASITRDLQASNAETRGRLDTLEKTAGA